MPTNMEASSGGSVETPGPASVAPLICSQGQAGPWRHLADPGGAGAGEGRQQGEAGWGDGATGSNRQPGGSAGCQYKQISINNHSFLKAPLACPIFLRTPPAQLLLIKDHLIHSQIIVCTNCLKQTEVHFTLFPKGLEGF